MSQPSSLSFTSSLDPSLLVCDVAGSYRPAAPAEVLQAALILVHNHPSGLAEPSRADEVLTQTLKSALALVDVRVIDHLIVAGPTILSFAERGLI